MAKEEFAVRGIKVPNLDEPEPEEEKPVENKIKKKIPEQDRQPEEKIDLDFILFL